MAKLNVLRGLWIALILVLFVACVALAASTAESTAPKLLQGALLLAGKTAAEVAAGIGQPMAQEKTKYGPKMTYILGSGATVEIVYIGGKADWITMTPRPGKRIPFAPQAITGIGLAEAKPTSRELDVIRWEHIQGLRKVSVHRGGDGTVWYFYIKAKTE